MKRNDGKGVMNAIKDDEITHGIESIPDMAGRHLLH